MISEKGSGQDFKRDVGIKSIGEDFDDIEDRSFITSEEETGSR